MTDLTSQIEHAARLLEMLLRSPADMDDTTRAQVLDAYTELKIIIHDLERIDVESLPDWLIRGFVTRYGENKIRALKDLRTLIPGLDLKIAKQAIERWTKVLSSG